MEDLLAYVLSASIGFIGFFIGQRLQHKNETLAKQAKWYEDELDNMRTEIKRYRSRASYYQKGAIPSELASEGNAGALIEGIISALPQNFRSIIMPFKGQIMQAVSDNPELVQQITGMIKTKLQGNGEQVANQQTDLL